MYPWMQSALLSVSAQKKVSIVYRRRVADMTALPEEIEGAVAEGIEVQTLKSPSRIVTDENGHVQGLYVTPQMISKIKDGRASVRPTGEEDQFIPCTTLIVAIGQDIEFQHFERGWCPGTAWTDHVREKCRIRKHPWRFCRWRLCNWSCLRHQSDCSSKGCCS